MWTRYVKYMINFDGATTAYYSKKVPLKRNYDNVDVRQGAKPGSHQTFRLKQNLISILNSLYIPTPEELLEFSVN